jgi:hypothetical protein
MKYLDRTWIGELNQRTKTRKDPLFNHTLWNKYQATLEGDVKTNNTIEGYNLGFSLSTPARASDWVVMDRFKTEETTRKSLLHQAAMGCSGSDKTSLRAQSRKDREEKLRCLVKNQPNMAIKAYMESLVTFFET